MSILFALLNVPAVTDLIGTDPVRLFESENVQQPVVYPYVVWRVVGGGPAATLEMAGFDNLRIQVDCYVGPNASPKDARALADAVQVAIENDGENVTASENGNDRDPDTKAFRYSRDYSIWVER